MATKSVMLRVTEGVVKGQLERVIGDVPGWALEPARTEAYDLLICEITKNKLEEEMNFIRDTVAGKRARNLILVSSLMDPNLLMEALHLGVKEFLPLPLDADQLKQAMRKLQNGNGNNGAVAREAPDKEGVVIHLMGSKGGVGTTTVAVNLASELVSAAGPPAVALVDMSCCFGDIPAFLGMQSYDFDLTEIANNISRLDRNFLAGTLYKHPSGIQVLPSPANILETLTSNPEVIIRLLSVMRTMFDYVIIDGGQGFGEISRAVVRQAQKVVVVTLLDVPCLINVKRLREAFNQLGYPAVDRVEIVANRFSRKSAMISLEDAERTLKRRVSWTVPNDFQTAMHAINMGKTFREMAGSKEIGARFSELAAGLRNGSKPAEERRTGLLGRVFSR